MTSSLETGGRPGFEDVERDGLAESDLGRLASAWHTDADLDQPIEVVTAMQNGRRCSFIVYQATDGSLLDLFERLRVASVIP